MNLPPHAIEALIDIKKELLSREAPAPEPEKPKEEAHQPAQVMRHAKTKAGGWQRYCQRGSW